MVGWGWGRGIRLGLWVDSSSLICDIGDISIITIGRILDMLDTSIGKSNRVRSGNIAGAIRLLLSVEVSLGVVIGNSVGEGVGGNLIGVGLGLVNWGGVDSMSHNWGGVDSVGNWVGNNWGVDGVSYNWGSVDGVVNWGVGNHMGWSMVWGKVTSMSDNTSVADGGVVSHVRGGGGGSK